MADLGNCDALKTSINNKVYTNTNYEVSAEDLRSSYEDTIDTLCSLIEASTGCEVQNYNVSSDYCSINATRVVCNDVDVSISGTITILDNTDTFPNNFPDKATLTDIIPQDFKDKSWFRINELTMVVDSVTNANGANAFGYLYMNDLSSYNTQADQTGDFTQFHINGSTRGESAYYEFDRILDPTALDSTYHGGGSTTWSPKDISVEGLTVEFRNSAYVQNITVTNCFGTVKFNLKGTLL